MPDVNRKLVQMFFELNGFFVRKGAYLLAKRISQGRTYSADFVLSADNIRNIKQAIVEVKGRHTETFYPSVLNSSPELFNFLSEESLGEAKKVFENQKFKKVLVISKLPRVKETLSRSKRILKEKGIDHIIEFPMILDFITGYLSRNVNYAGDDLLQLMRIFKCYDLYRPSQMELFSSSGKKKSG